MSEILRTLPVRFAPLDGEALDSWLEALARRLHTPLGDLARAAGLPPRGSTGNQLPRQPADWTILLQPQQAAAVSATTGLAEARIHAMTLRHYDQRALTIDPERRRVRISTLWGRGSGSRFCPDCLTENSGRWMLSWRLGWSFACLRHRRLLADCCPHCGRIPRRRPRSSRSVPDPGRCGNTPTGPGRFVTSGCGFDLADADTLSLDTDHPALAAQALLLDVIEKGTATFGAYALAPQPASAALTDIRAVCGRVLSSLSIQDLAKWVPADLTDEHLHPDPGCTLAVRAEQRPGFMSPPRAVTAATAVTAALHVLNQPDIHRAGAALRPLLEAIRDDEAQVSPATIWQWGRGVSPVLTAVHLAGLAPSCRPSDHLRHRLPAQIPRLPARTNTDIMLRSRKIPSMFWNSWTVRLAPPEGTFARILASALAASLLIVDSRIDFDTATRRLGNVIEGHDLSRVLQRLDNHPGWADLVTALVRLADHLDAVDVPIDYARRRDLDYSDLLPTEHWAAICRRTDTPPGGGLYEQTMRCYLFQQISGLPIEAAPGHPGTNDAEFRAEYARRAALRTPELAQALHEEAQAFLASHRIDDEPVTWQPPTSLLDGLNLPGQNPDRVDIHLLHKLVRQREHPAQHAAAVLGTSVEAVRHLLDQHPAPAIPATKTQARAVGRAFNRAMEELPKAELTRLYLDERRSLQQIGELTGISRGLLTRLASQYGIPLRSSGLRDYKRHAEVEADWLLEQYVHRRRTLRDLAREKGMSPAHMNRWAKTHNIPVRRGGASHNATLRAAERATQAPAFLREALTSTYAWDRLQRFIAALSHDTMREAAEALGITQSTLVTQINRLERDLGQPLIERAQRGQPMRPTAFGTKIVDAARAMNTHHEESTRS
ncbi:TniQ family protein [Streptomyces alboflavus]|uniref:TniQ family protein n=1 Tax=Streptomyces alboflavus TaxID=67267 RepID=UPI0036883010